MTVATKFFPFVQNLANKTYNLASDVIKVMLTNVAPSQTNASKTDITEIAAGNGYTAGGVTIPISSGIQTAGTYKLLPSGNVTWTASGGTIATFRYAVFYDDTAASNQLMFFYDYGSAITLNDTDVFQLTLDTSNGILQIV